MTHSFPTRRSSDLLNFRGTVNYSHARYGSFLAPCYSGESIAAGCNTTFRGGTGQRLDGKPTTNSPPWTGSLGGSYDTDIGGGKSISLNVDTRYRDGYFASDFNSPLSYQGSSVNIDASIRSEEHTSELQSIMRLTYAVY